MPVLPRRDGFYWVVSPAWIADALDRWLASWLNNLDRELQSVGVRIKEYAKSNHPWSNITGEAERSLEAEVLVMDGGNRAIVLYADPSISAEGAEHVFWLEVRWDGQYGVIRATLEAHYGDVMDAVKASVRNAKP